MQGNPMGMQGNPMGMQGMPGMQVITNNGNSVTSTQHAIPNFHAFAQQHMANKMQLNNPH